MKYVLLAACVLALVVLVTVIAAQALHVACGEVVGTVVKVCTVPAA